MTDRFTEIISTQIIIDNVTGEHYTGVVDDEFLELVNDINKRADRNAELVTEMKDIDCIAQYTFVKKILKIMRKYEIDNLEKLDRILFERGVW